MTQEEKSLLLQDLCARLPYGVICTDNRHGDSRIFNIDIEDERVYYTDFDEWGLIKNCKPYLRPMSSMTEEEKEYIQTCFDIITDENYGDGYSPSAWDAINNFTNYCDSRYLDHRGLIWRELALPAPEGMYK